MKLLILTQKIDASDDVLGFFHTWIEEFAKNCEQVTVIALGTGIFKFPANVRVLSLGKEQGSTRLGYLFHFFRYIISERKNYDVVFVHMNQIYVLLGFLPWKFMRKKIGLWYTHKHVDWTLSLATHLTDIIFTASSESFRIDTQKCHVMGHGIDAGHYRGIAHVESDIFRVLSVARLSRTKGYSSLLGALSKLPADCRYEVIIVGGPKTEEDELYKTEIEEEVRSLGLESKVRFIGPVPNNHIDTYLAQADLFVNMSETGSLDKAVLEAMAARIPVLTSNPGLRSTLKDYEECMFTPDNADEFASRLRSFMNMSKTEREKLGSALGMIVEREHDIKNLIPRITAYYSQN